MGRVAQGAEKLAQNGTVTTGLLSMMLRAHWVKAYIAQSAQHIGVKDTYKSLIGVRWSIAQHIRLV
jgi:hypothetical protein